VEALAAGAWTISSGAMVEGLIVFFASFELLSPKLTGADHEWV